MFTLECLTSKTRQRNYYGDDCFPISDGVCGPDCGPSNPPECTPDDPDCAPGDF